MKPMLARTYGPKFSRFPCFAQPKLNGVRALYQSGQFQSRGEKMWKPSFFPHIVEQIESLSPGPVILDGEFYVHGWRLQRINSAVGVKNNKPNDDTPSIVFHVFDVANALEKFSTRWLDHYNYIRSANLSHVQVVPTTLVQNAIDVEIHFCHYTSLGYEGIMLRPDGPYEIGEHIGRFGLTERRSNFLWKHKAWHDGEFECVRVTPGEGKAAIGIGALGCLTNEEFDDGDGNKYQNEFFVGTGFDDEERVAFAKDPPIGRLIRVRYISLSDLGIPQNPSFIAVM